MPIYHVIHDRTSKDKMKRFAQVNHLLGHFCRSTGVDPSGSVTNHLEALYEMLQAGATNWEIHRMIDLFAGNMPCEPGTEFENFQKEFWSE